MNLQSYLLDDVAGLLVKYASLHQLDNETALLKTLVSYGKKRSLNNEVWLEHLDELAHLTDNPAIGLELGQLAEIKHGGILGYLISSCDNLGQASMQFARYQSLLYGSEATFTNQGKRYRITWPATEVPLYRSDECLIAAIITITRQLTNKQDASPHAVGFQHERPAYIEKYQQLLGDNIHFAVSNTYIEFPEDYLSLRIARSDSALKKLLKQQADTLLSVFRQQDEFDTQLRDALLEILNTGDATLAKLAELMGVSTRTLQRKLQERHIHFSELLEKSRKELAVDYLKNRELSLTDIGFLLAYSEQSAFTRAFRNWFGMTPKTYRKKFLT